MYIITVDAELCEGCGDCVSTCPNELMGMVENVAQYIGDPNDCIGCYSCESACPNGSIVITEN